MSTKDVTENNKIYIAYNSGRLTEDVLVTFPLNKGKIKETKSHYYEYLLNETYENDGTAVFLDNGYYLKHAGKEQTQHFQGWNLRLKIEEQWYWYMQDGSIQPVKGLDKNLINQIGLFYEKNHMPLISYKEVTYIVAVAVWKDELDDGQKRFKMAYNSGRDSKEVVAAYNLFQGHLKTTKSGNYEYWLDQELCNTGMVYLDQNRYVVRHDYIGDDLQFAGWKLRMKIQDCWYWYMADGTVSKKEDNEKCRIFSVGEAIPLNLDMTHIVATALWKTVK